MGNWIESIVLLAAEGGADPDVPPWGPIAVYVLPALIVFMIVQMIFGRADSREKSKRDQMIGALKKNDPVVTIGGILGTVVSVSEDKREVTIKVDDNTRLKMLASAIREVVTKDSKEAT